MMKTWVFFLFSFSYLILACTLVSANGLTPAQSRIIQWARENARSDLPRSHNGILATNYLIVEKKNLTELPDEILELKNLNHLIIRNTQMSDLPEVIGKLSRLDTLDISKNQFKRIPTVLFKKEGLPLRELNLSENPLTSLEGLEHLSTLKSLSIANCGLDEAHFSNALSNMSKLRVLNLADNLISILPPDISNLPIRNLYLENNPIHSLPANLADLRRLNYLTLSWETLKTDPDERLLDLFYNNGIMGSLCRKKLGVYDAENRQCICAQTKSINPIREDCKEEIRNAVRSYMKPLSEDLLLFRWGSAWGNQLVEEQKFNIETVNQDCNAAAGPGLYLAETPWSSMRYGKEHGTLVEVTLPKGKLYLDEAELRVSKIGVLIYEIGQNALANGALRYSVSAGWWVVNDQSGLSYRLFDGTGHDEATLHQYYMKIKDCETAKEIFIRQIQEGNCDLTKRFVGTLAGS